MLVGFRAGLEHSGDGVVVDFREGLEPAGPEVKVALVHRVALHDGGQRLAQGEHLPRLLAVDAGGVWEQDQVRTDLEGLGGRHRRIDTAGPCFVAGRGDDAPLPSPHRG